MSKPDYLPKKLKKLEWLTAICPVCEEEYQYLPDYKPSTCGKFNCLYEIAMKKLRGDSCQP